VCVGGDHYLQSRDAYEVRLRMLGMVVPPADTTADRHPDHHPRRVLTSRTVAVLRKLIHNLLISWPNEVRKLDFGHRHHSIQRHSDGCADDAVLSQRRIDHALVAKLVPESRSHAEDPPDLADVLAKHDHL